LNNLLNEKTIEEFILEYQKNIKPKKIKPERVVKNIINTEYKKFTFGFSLPNKCDIKK
jgi:hypothetical protein